jgi:hypothetical protein
MNKLFRIAGMVTLLAVAPMAMSGCGGSAQTVADSSTEGTSADAANTVSPPTAARVVAGVQQVTIELPAGYKSDVAALKAGRPAAITFLLKEDAGCGNEVVVPDAKWRKTLKVGQRATVKYTPSKSGQLKFACGMNHFKGSIVVQ